MDAPTRDALTRTWALLVGLSLATTVLSAWDARLAVPGLMLLAWLKARCILGSFLHLKAAQGWLAAFTVPLALWLVAIAALVALR